MSEWKTLKAKYEHVIKYETEQANDDRVFLLWMKWQKVTKGKKKIQQGQKCVREGCHATVERLQFLVLFATVTG